MTFNPKIGAFVLETLTTGMYADPFDSLREYIQNASDAIFAAERQSLIAKNSGRIIVEIDPVARNITVRDNGTGISSSEAPARLLNIGMSAKEYGVEAGFRGIGRLAGIAYCSELTFSTSSMYEDERCTVTFDCEGIRRAISPSMRQVEELSDVIRNNTNQDILQEMKDAHYFEVKMSGIDSTVPQFLNLVAMEDYLSQVAPIEYDGQRFDFASKIEQGAADVGLTIPHVSLLLQSPELGDPRQVFKPYRRAYKTKKGDFQIDIKDVEFRYCENDSGLQYWMWFSKTDLLGMIDDPKVAGLRFRKNNIAIGGPERVAELFPGNEGRLNYWLIGEIHAIDNDVIPNARRDGFENTPALEALTTELAPFIKEHCKACHDASVAANRPTVKVVTAAKSTIATVKKSLQVGLASSDERDALLAKLEKEESRVQTALDKKDNKTEKQEIQKVLTSISDVRENLQAHKGFTVAKLRSNLDRKQKKILIEVMEIVDSALRRTGCKQSVDCLSQIKKDILKKYGVV